MAEKKTTTDEKIEEVIEELIAINIAIKILAKKLISLSLRREESVNE